MADVVLFNSAAGTNKRILLVADDGTGAKTLKVKDSADADVWTHLLTQDQVNRLCSVWANGEEQILRLDNDANIWVALTKNKQTAWPGAPGADEDTVSENVTLDEVNTAMLMGWIQEYTPTAAP